MFHSLSCLGDSECDSHLPQRGLSFFYWINWAQVDLKSNQQYWESARCSLRTNEACGCPSRLEVSGVGPLSYWLVRFPSTKRHEFLLLHAIGKRWERQNTGERKGRWGRTRHRSRITEDTLAYFHHDVSSTFGKYPWYWYRCTYSQVKMRTDPSVIKFWDHTLRYWGVLLVMRATSHSVVSSNML